ncbi:hypothetical protein M2427_007328 [Bradyrhizobium sp. BR13661]|jgi:hypothetical protein|nr:hypothetical protein [Bradyrhizobium sp. BR13661]
MRDPRNCCDIHQLQYARPKPLRTPGRPHTSEVLQRPGACQNRNVSMHYLIAFPSRFAFNSLGEALNDPVASARDTCAERVFNKTTSPRLPIFDNRQYSTGGAPDILENYFADMTRGNPPILICRECRRPIDFLAMLPHIANLPAIYVFRCLPCRRVDTITIPS